ncbi:thioesterase II family protein [Actinomadura sp. GTD37]|uniref:thioesterase II family protein n=1 Tax=Actinomadura sp. GTD37 TaxID=1778030 RepID=UPI0035C1262B
MTGEDPRDWFWSPAPGGNAAVALVCLPGLGGDAGLFRGWQERLPPGVRLHAARLPGRPSRLSEPPIEDPAELTARLAGAVLALPEEQIVLFGYSMGAAHAYEAARALAAADRPPGALAVAARGAPDAAAPPFGRRTRPELVALLRDLGLTPPEVLADPALLDLVLPSVRADLLLADRYSPVDGAPVECPLLALAGAADPLWPVDGVRGWARYTRGGFTLHVLPGGHDLLAAGGPAAGRVGQFVLEATSR